jgi:hypothetical protein
VNVVETERLTLREFADADVDALYEIQGDRQHMRFTFSSASREDCENCLHRYARTRRVNGFASWTIVHRADNRIIGWGGLSIDPLAPGWGPEVAYFIHPSSVRGSRLCDRSRSRFVTVRIPGFEAECYRRLRDAPESRIGESAGKVRLPFSSIRASRSTRSTSKSDWTIGAGGTPLLDIALAVTAV